ncbi:unnamed protein product [Psylliodes chrysocephalus]|uniref:CCHC-type domain-containing protein n=1 Tax=Psylliodes chrysocephalus TaxID=3402493 RepID=A0A9P0G2D9_9CUCU|nr:unnamed protein product [Psylliodes chrysocephala]
MPKGGVDVIVNDIQNNPQCPHGPTILFLKQIKGGEIKKYFSCSACRDKKECKFFLWMDQKNNYNKATWDLEIMNFKKGINHRQMFINLNEILEANTKKWFCNTCNELSVDGKKHNFSHLVLKGLTVDDLERPSEILPPLNDSKKEAQYHFSESSVEVIIRIFKQLRYQYVICVGTPRIHEYIKNKCPNLSSILLDIDKRFHNFFGPLEFCWYNMFNNHFFFDEAQDVFETYLQSNRGKGMVLITDPPFGGRTEILSATFNRINESYKKLNDIKTDLPMFWIYPYFMEPQIVNVMPNFTMLDYKIEYDNHRSFQNSPKGRKHGSPIRLFTNLKPSLIELPSKDYKYCDMCERWVSKENRHCGMCHACTSKNGETYTHCYVCMRCVKPSWKHCQTCNRCAQVDHTCKTLAFIKECFNCKEKGHKKTNCPLLTIIDKQEIKKPLTKVDKQEKRKPLTYGINLKKKLKT